MKFLLGHTIVTSIIQGKIDQGLVAKLYIPSTPNNSNETHTFMCLGRTGRFGQHLNCSKIHI